MDDSHNISQPVYTDADLSAVMSEMGRRGARARWAKLSGEERSAFASRIASRPRKKKVRKSLKTKGK
jgi:hypothetical protein